MNSTQGPLEPEKRKGSPYGSPATEGRRAQAYTAPPRLESFPGKKRKSWLVPLVAALCLAGAVGVGSFEYLSHQAPAPVPVVTQQAAKNVLTLSGADVNEAKTAQAIADIKAGINSPLTAHLSDQVKQQILSGERKFYSLPVSNPAMDHHANPAVPGNPATPGTSPSPSTPAAPPAPASPTAPADQTPQPAPVTAASSPEQAPQPTPIATGDRISISVNGALYGVFDLTNVPLTLDVPLSAGDHWDVTCIAVGEGRLSVVVDLATVLNPVETRALTPGETASFTVGPSVTGQNYGWFQQQAQSGNPTAEYGLGHMYQYGLGVQQDNSQAIYWYRQAAAQNYLDAQTQLSRMGTQ